MNVDQEKPIEIILTELRERAKELNCLYEVEEILNQSELTLDDMFLRIAHSIKSNVQFPTFCAVKIMVDRKVFETQPYEEGSPQIESRIRVQYEQIGYVRINYSPPRADANPLLFLREEKIMLKTITNRLGFFLLHQRLKKVFKSQTLEMEGNNKNDLKDEWEIIMSMLQHSDMQLFKRISQKMLYHLCLMGVQDADNLLASTNQPSAADKSVLADENRPLTKLKLKDSVHFANLIFKIAKENINNAELNKLIQKWISEDKISALVKVLENFSASLTDISNAIFRYYEKSFDSKDISISSGKSIITSLIRLILTEDLSFIRIAKDYLTLHDFYLLLKQIILPPESHGKIGGKSSGMLIAKRILDQKTENETWKQGIKIPKTWYIASDGIMAFIQFNDLEDVLEQKYKSPDQIRIEYPYLIQLFKNSSFPPDLIKSISLVLDDFGNVPLVVRSSSLLEDQVGAAFSGKYKSLFLANQGNKDDCLSALLDAIAEVYASTFNPDAIQYRQERGLLDFREEMGILIQEVVGKKVGQYYFPLFAGVAFSNNEFRWSPRIKQKDGLVRLVPGLGTRAVDRLSDDYPVLVAPGQPKLRVNVTMEEKVKYAPSKIDVINLVDNTFETIDLQKLLQKHRSDIPGIEKMVSLIEADRIRQPIGYEIEDQYADLLVTFEGLISQSDFLLQMKNILTILEESFNTPVDIEFAHDGQNLYLLQCRSQSHSHENAPAVIPKNIDLMKILFTANRYITNGLLTDITHIVYIDPLEYSNLESKEELLSVGRCVGKLNQLLPKKQFILMGPGRWGSRGDIQLGVSVTYVDISNTAMLIEIAKQKGNYTPDLSFGTHFFQDLVEDNIKYLPLYPDESDVIFNERFFVQSHNSLEDFIPECKNFSHVVKVIDVPKWHKNYRIAVAMNEDTEEAIAYLTCEDCNDCDGISSSAKDSVPIVAIKPPFLLY